MIKAEIKKNEKGDSLILKIRGHAKAAPAGEDIICSAASTLVYTLAQLSLFFSEQGKLRKKPVIKTEEGEGEIVLKPKKEHYAEVMQAFFFTQVGLSLLAENYPSYVKMYAFGKSYGGSKSE